MKIENTSTKNKILLPLILLVLGLFSHENLKAQKYVEKLNRGVVAIRTSTSQVFVGWRMLGTDPTNVGFNLYRNGTKINASPITNSSNYQDNTTTNGSYSVRAVINGTEQAASAAASTRTNNFWDIPISAPPTTPLPGGASYTYNANDCSVGDVDGDGEYEIFLKWDPSNAKDNSQAGYTGYVYIDCYKLNGTRLWRINLGKNIRAGAHYTQFMVYDFDSDGKAEMACKTADSTVDGKGVVIGVASADYRTVNGYVLSGPEYLSIFRGTDGAALARTNYLPARGNVGDWGDTYGNRVDRFIAAVAYLDGQRPSLIMGRGYYTKLIRVAWDWRNGALTQRWIFDSGASGNSAYFAQGNHQMTIGDVDNDGKDDVGNGSSMISETGGRQFANGLGHGDALHMSDMDPDRAGQEIFQPHEDPGSYGSNGICLKDAKTGVPIWGFLGSGGDVGRGCAADIDPRTKGYECWASNSSNVFSCKGVVVSSTKPSSTNFAVWWDGDLSRELLDGNRIDKWDYNNGTTANIFTATNYLSCNGTKSTPSLSADLFGDWREEVIWRKSDNTSLRIFTTTAINSNKIYTLMHDPQYRVAIAWQNSAYNQPPHPSFYLGTGMVAQAKPDIITTPGTAVGRESAEIIEEKSSITDEGYKIEIAPNPSTKQFTLKAEGKFDYSIADVTGKICENGAGKNEAIVGEKLKKGLYIINVTSQLGKKAQVKLMRQ
jgi:rhamnogalacturonan endolyase